MLKIVYHEGYLSSYYTSRAESPIRVKAIYNKLKHHYDTVFPVAATKEEVLRVHSPLLVTKIQQEGKDTYEAALLAVGGALCAAQLAIEGKSAFGIIRPPGHHASQNRYGRFCFFNNMAIAITSLLERGFIQKALIIDTDMHEGDGTQRIFSEDPNVIVIDIWARDPQTYLNLLSEELDGVPPVDIIGICAGFDLYVHDWGGLLETEDFYEIGRIIHQTTIEKAKGHCFALLEGGYFLNDLGKNVLAFCKGLEGEEVSKVKTGNEFPRRRST